MDDLHGALRAWAKGLYATEAGVELLIRHGKAIYDGAPWLVEPGSSDGLDEFRARRVMVDVDALVAEAGAWSAGERRLVAIAASLLSQEREVNLSDVLSGLDRPHQELVLAAVAHAAGSREGTNVTFDHSGHPRFQRASSLFTWPGDQARELDATPTPLGAKPDYGPAI